MAILVDAACLTNKNSSVRFSEQTISSADCQVFFSVLFQNKTVFQQNANMLQTAEIF